MTFLELQNELLPAGVGNTARFKESQRKSVQRWLNDRYAEVWGLEDWTFRKNLVTLAVTAAADKPAMPTDFGIANKLWDDQGAQLKWVEPSLFFGYHLANTNAGQTSTYTVVNEQIYLDPAPSGALSYTLLYERALTLLAVDADVPRLPVEHHYMLVHGAEATGQTRMNDFTYQFAEQRWQNQLAALRRNFLADQRGEPAQWGSAWGSSY